MRVDLRDDADDVSLARRDGEDARPAAADEDRRHRPLRRARRELRALRAVVRPGVLDLLAGEEAPQQPDRLEHAVDAHARLVVGDAQSVVVAPVPAGAEPQLEASAGEEIERRDLLREEERVAEVVREDEAPDAEGRRRVGDGQERGDRRELPPGVVGHQEDVVSEGFRAARLRDPLVARRRPGRGDGEAERAGHGRPSLRPRAARSAP